jgi:hypothetical protein
VLPSLDDLIYVDAAAAHDTAPIPAAALAPGVDLILRTAAGHPVKARVTGHTGSGLALAFVT